MARVLVVDDDPAGLEIRKLILERHGHAVTGAADAPSARTAFRAAPPDTVILDLRLPQTEDGLALIREFRAARPALRIVILAGCATDLENRSEAALVDQVLAKPVRSARLLDALSPSSQ